MQQVITVINTVNNYWQNSNPTHGRAFWDNAAYGTGNMQVHTLTKNNNLVFCNQREAPAVLKKQNTCYLITSGCSGWQPGKATMHTATNFLADR